MRPIATAAALFLLSAPTGAQVEIRALTGTLEGHDVGGVTIDMIGNVYVADFGDIVWKVTPEGQRTTFVSGLYGTSGNAIDNQGHLLQASFYADEITRVDRNGQAQPFVTGQVSRPAGLAVDRKTGDVYVTSCTGNSVVKVSRDGAVAPFARSDLFNCPYGIAFDRAGNLHVVNYNDNRMTRIDPQGAVTLFASVSEKGLAHLCFKKDRFYVTAFWSHAIYEVTLDRKVTRVLGNGERAIVDGVGADARLSFPMGIACHPWAPRLYVNEELNESGVLPRRSTVRTVLLKQAT